MSQYVTYCDQRWKRRSRTKGARKNAWPAMPPRIKYNNAFLFSPFLSSSASPLPSFSTSYFPARSRKSRAEQGSSWAIEKEGIQSLTALHLGQYINFGTPTSLKRYNNVFMNISYSLAQKKLPSRKVLGSPALLTWRFELKAFYMELPLCLDNLEESVQERHWKETKGWA